MKTKTLHSQDAKKVGISNYHNILIAPDGMTVVNFEHVGRDIQPSDLYYFLRKVMEKHQWNEKNLLWTGRPACALWQLYLQCVKCP